MWFLSKNGFFYIDNFFYWIIRSGPRKSSFGSGRAMNAL